MCYGQSPSENVKHQQAIVLNYLFCSIVSPDRVTNQAMRASATAGNEDSSRNTVKLHNIKVWRKPAIRRDNHAKKAA
jgi:hypothetical protein